MAPNPIAIVGVPMEAFSHHSSRSDAGSGGDDNRTTVMNNRRSNHNNNNNNNSSSSSHRLMDLYMSHMPPSLLVSDARTATRRNRGEDDRSAADRSTGSWSSVATPPPPTTAPPTTHRSGLLSIFRTHKEDDHHFQDELEQQRVTDHPRGAWILERTDSVESVDESEWPSHWNSFFPRLTKDSSPPRRTGKGRRRWACIVGLFLFVVCAIVVGLSVGMTHHPNEPKARSSDLSAVDQDEEDAVGVQTASPTRAAPSPPTTTAVVPTRVPAVHTPTKMPTTLQSCQDVVQVDRRCYNVRDLETVAYQTTFTSCHPHAENWIGVFPAGHDAERLPDPLLWLWTCNSQNVTDCDNEGTPSGVLGIGGVLEPGFYQAALVPQDGIAPFSSSVISPVFQISDNC